MTENQIRKIKEISNEYLIADVHVSTPTGNEIYKNVDCEDTLPGILDKHLTKMVAKVEIASFGTIVGAGTKCNIEIYEPVEYVED